MTIEKIEKLRRHLEEMWGRIANIRASEFDSILTAVGRKRIKKSTKHPMYESSLPGRPNFSVWGHPGAGDKGWAKDIITQLYKDLDELEKIELSRLKNLTEGNGHV